MTPRYLGHKNIQHRVRYSSSPPNTLPFRLTDAAGRILAHVYFEDEPTRWNFSTRSSKDDARRMAQQILRLPELVRIAKGIDPSEA